MFSRFSISLTLILALIQINLIDLSEQTLLALQVRSRSTSPHRTEAPASADQPSACNHLEFDQTLTNQLAESLKRQLEETKNESKVGTWGGSILNMCYPGIGHNAESGNKVYSLRKIDFTGTHCADNIHEHTITSQINRIYDVLGEAFRDTLQAEDGSGIQMIELNEFYVLASYFDSHSDTAINYQTHAKELAAKLKSFLQEKNVDQFKFYGRALKLNQKPNVIFSAILIEPDVLPDLLNPKIE